MEHSDAIWFINGKTHKQYVDYIDLVHPRTSAQKAIWMALITLFITLCWEIGPKVLLPLPSPPYQITFRGVDNEEDLKNLMIEVQKLNHNAEKAGSLLNTIYINDTIA